MIREKRGQAAMEFLMTYGWAILAAIIVIAVIAIYFRPSSLVQTSVIVTAPLYGVGTTISATQIQVEIKNNGGEDIVTSEANVTINNPSGANCDLGTGNGSMISGDTQILTFVCTGLTAGDTISSDVAIGYERPGSSLLLRSTGSVSGKVA